MHADIIHMVYSVLCYTLLRLSSVEHLSRAGNAGTFHTLPQVTGCIRRRHCGMSPRVCVSNADKRPARVD